MNKIQKRILLIGITIIALMGLFPPHYSYGIGGLRRGPSPARDNSGLSYDLLFFTNPSQLALAHLAIQWIIISVLTAGAIYTTKESSEKKQTRLKEEI